MPVPGRPEKVKPSVYHDQEIRRGFRVLHQFLNLDVDLDTHTLRGSAEFSLRVLNQNCFEVKVNLRRCRVVSCFINGIPTTSTYASAIDFPPLLNAVSSDSPPHRTGDVKDEVNMQNAMSNEGELTIAVPPTVSADLLEDLKALSPPRDSAAPATTPTPSPPATTQLHELPAMNVRIEYEVSNPTAGAVFYGSADSESALDDPKYMLTESRYGLVRCWMPCFDSLHWCDRFIFDMDVTVRSSLVVVASGDLTSTRIIPSNEKCAYIRKLHCYRSSVPALAKEIVIAVGPFMPFPDPALPNTVTHFCLPGQAEKLVQTSPPLFASALSFCRDYFGFDPPCTSFKHLFLGPLGDEDSTNFCAAGGLAVISGKLLCTKRCIDAGFKAREAIMSTLVQSYVGCLLRPRSVDDAWIIKGLAAHVTALGLQALFGRNWYRFRIMDEMNILCEESPASAVVLTPIDPAVHIDVTAQAASRRAHIIVYMIERRIGSDIMRRALRDLVAEGRNVVIALYTAIDCCKKSQGASCFSRESLHSLVMKAFASQNSLDLAKTGADDNAEKGDAGSSPVNSKRVGGGAASGFDDGLLGIGVGPFLKRLRAICGTDVRGLVRLWAASRGVPRLHFGYRYNNRRHLMEFVGKQEGLESLYKGKQGLQFVGTVHVKVMEVEGASDHSVEIRDGCFVLELPFHSRRTKQQKSTGQGEKSTRDDSSPIVWVRVDTDLEWCMDAKFTQAEYAWASLLKSERDSVAQFKACRGLAQFGTEFAGKALADILEDDQVYWRVHAAAANALAQCEGGLDALLKFCRKRYTDQGGDGRENVKLNNFGDFRDYFVKRAIVKAIVKTRTSNENNRGSRTKIPQQAVQFIFELLKGNDNAGNAYDDDYYVSDLIEAAGTIAVQSVDDQLFSRSGVEDTSASGLAVQQINRYRALDRLLPSKSGAVACSLLKSLSEYEAAKLGCMERKRVGTPVRDIIHGRHKPNDLLLQLIYNHCSVKSEVRVRVQALKALALVYSGDLDVCLWLLSRVDRDFADSDLIDKGFHPTVSSSAVQIENPVVRLGVLQGLIGAVSTKLWGRRNPPLLDSLRRNSSRERAICIRIRRLMVGDADDRIRTAAYQFALRVWGNGPPVCFLSRSEYFHACNIAKEFANQPEKLRKRVIPCEFRFTQKEIIVPVKPLKPVKPPKTTKSHKHGRHKSSKSAPLTTFGKPVSTKSIVIPKIERASLPKPVIPKSRPKPVVSLRSVAPPKPESAPIPLSKPVPKIIPKSKPLPPRVPAPALPGRTSKSVVPMSRPKPARMSFSAENLDVEDMRYLKKAWKEKRRGSSSGGSEGRGGRESIDHERPESGDVEKAGRRAKRDDGGDGHKKKRKKKKRKLSDVDGVDGAADASGKERRKKKKKRRKKLESQDNIAVDADTTMEDGARPGSSSHQPLTPEEPKIANIKIKLSRNQMS